MIGPGLSQLPHHTATQDYRRNTLPPTSESENSHYLKLSHTNKQQLNMINKTDLLFWAIALLAFYGLARLGELLPNNQLDANK
ncbi:13484_t:CDS:1, partial [Dentiscutata erythropus]